MNRLLTAFFSVVTALCGGCIVLPLPPHTVEGVNAGAKVGRAGSWTRPLKVGQATQLDVARSLGPPDQSYNGDRQWSYSWTIRTGVALGLTFADGPVDLIDRSRVMWLNFDGSGILTAYEVVDDDTIGPGYGFPPFVPPDRSDPFASQSVPFYPPMSLAEPSHARPPLPVP